jgi:hypothetical protein
MGDRVLPFRHDSASRKTPAAVVIPGYIENVDEIVAVRASESSTEP